MSLTNLVYAGVVAVGLQGESKIDNSLGRDAATYHEVRESTSENIYSRDRIGMVGSTVALATMGPEPKVDYGNFPLTFHPNTSKPAEPKSFTVPMGAPITSNNNFSYVLRNIIAVNAGLNMLSTFSIAGSIYLVNRVARRRRKSFKDYIEASQQGEDFGS